ncbi:MAG: transporter [Pirellula sp.]|nr:transporter [Pirellula sp.]
MPSRRTPPREEAQAFTAVLRWLCWGLLLLTAAGCTSPVQYVRNRFKVGPNYATPRAPVAADWIDATDKRVRTDTDDLAGWWTVLNDPLLDQLMVDAYRQNLTLREAGFRILGARAQAGIAVGSIFPQQQGASGGYQRFGVGENFFSQFNFGFNLGWELDFWGRYRRAIIAAEANLDASVFDYDDVLVTLLSDVGTAYVNIRTSEERIRLLENIIGVQRDVLAFISERLAAGRGVTELDRAQARSNLKQSEASLNQLRIALRTSQNQLCILLGMPVTDLGPMLQGAPSTKIPLAPDFVVVGIPADLLRRRPDVRRAERIAASQAEQIGIAEANLYPAISINGTLGWSAQQFSDLFSPQALNSSVGPSFQWNLLNYGRLTNNIRLQDAVFQQAVVNYQSTVLQAGLEVENGIVTFLQSQERLKNLDESVAEAYRALEVVIAQYEAGAAGVDFNRYATIQQTLVTQQDLWVQSRGDVAQSLIDVYRALGGGWQIRRYPPPDKQGILSPPPTPEDEPPAGENLPIPPVPQ